MSAANVPRVPLLALGLWLLLAGELAALAAVGTIREIDTARGLLRITANGRDRVLTIAGNVQALAADGTPLAGGLQDPQLQPGAEVTVTVERGAGKPVVQVVQLGKHGGGPQRNGNREAIGGKTSVGLKPLNEMTATDRYKDEDGGLYGGGSNDPPLSHLAAAREQTRQIVPLDAAGKPAKTGKIGLISISMSNATMEFSRFKQIADEDAAKSAAVIIVDCAQGGQAMAAWTDADARAWAEADRRLAAAGVSAEQVQVAWVKLANKRPDGDLQEHGRILERGTIAVLNNARLRFPNLRLAYLGSRIYGGYTTKPLNPEPYAYEGAFVVRWLIQAQIAGQAALAYDHGDQPAKAPLLLWGPYLWADGIVPRQDDGLVWRRQDLGGDGTHPSASGRQKVAEMLLRFFKVDPLAATWFVGKR